MTTIRIIVGLIVVGVIVALIAIQCKKNGKPFPWLIMIAIFVLLAITVGVRGCNKKAEVARSEARERFRTNPPPARITVSAQQPWTIQTFNIPEGGMVKHLYPGWKTFPLGGKIEITNPNGETLYDEPGVDNQFGSQPGGDYIFRANPPGSKRGVRIYNRW